jgi:molybdenum cofactor biosynthesis protein B|tara:strand:- start:594 stop:1094 length:501 start_codon:yes stop_codon:yes gene_type:complete
MKVNIAILTVTDTRTFDNDKSGAILVEKIKEANHNLKDRKICKDNKQDIIIILREWISKNDIDVIITTGGTGLTGRDITPEAIDEIADKHIPGFGEVFRNISLKTVGTSAIQSRACAVLANGKYVFALPGSSGGVTDAWDGILKHQLDINNKPCNFVELFPRLKEK